MIPFWYSSLWSFSVFHRKPHKETIKYLYNSTEVSSIWNNGLSSLTCIFMSFRSIVKNKKLGSFLSKTTWTVFEWEEIATKTSISYQKGMHLYEILCNYLNLIQQAYHTTTMLILIRHWYLDKWTTTKSVYQQCFSYY